VGRLVGRQRLADTVRILVVGLVDVHIDRTVVEHTADHWHVVAAGKASYPLPARSTTCYLRIFTCRDAQ
jgi:hypothetical protein